MMSIEEARNILFDKFSNIEFIEEGHKYYVRIGKKRDSYTSVSNIIKKYIVPFETDKVATNYAIKHNLNKDDVLRDWKYNNLCSTISGSRTHLYGEGYTWLKSNCIDKIPSEIYKQYVKEENWLIPTSHKEESVKKFYDELSPSIQPVGAEFIMSSQYIENCNLKICGTADILFYYNHPTDENKSGFIIGDWKTNKDLFSKYKRDNKITMYPPFDDMIDEDFSHYTLQFNLYQLMMESVGIKIIGRRLIWLKDDGYQIFKINDITDKVRKILC